MVYSQYDKVIRLNDIMHGIRENGKIGNAGIVVPYGVSGGQGANLLHGNF